MTLPEALKQLTIGEAMPKGAPAPTAATTAALEQLRAAIADDARNSEAQLRLEVQRRAAAESVPSGVVRHAHLSVCQLVH